MNLCGGNDCISSSQNELSPLGIESRGVAEEAVKLSDAHQRAKLFGDLVASKNM